MLSYTLQIITTNIENIIMHLQQFYFCHIFCVCAGFDKHESSDAQNISFTVRRMCAIIIEISLRLSLMGCLINAPCRMHADSRPKFTFWPIYNMSKSHTRG